MGKKSRLKFIKREIQEKINKRKTQLDLLISDIAVLFVLGIILYLIVYIFQPGYLQNFDSNYHAAALASFSRALGQGQIPVRWTDWIKGEGAYSMPLFSFYQVGFYYLASLFKLLIPSVTETIKFTVLSMWYLGAFFMYMFMRRFGRLPAIFAALIFTYTPYLILDVFVRGSFPEFIAIPLFVGLFWLFDRTMINAGYLHGVFFTLLLGFTIITHLPAVIIFLPVLICYGIFLFFTGQADSRGIIYLIIGTVLGFLLSSFYLIPALFELPLTKTNDLLTGYYSFSNHFVYPEQLFKVSWGYGPSVEGPSDQMSFQFGLIQWGIIISSFLIVLISYIFNKLFKYRVYYLYWLIVLFYAVFFMTGLSAIFWQTIPFLKLMQFPWRFLMLVPLASAVLGGLLISFINRIWLKFLIILFCGLFFFLGYKSYLTPASWTPKDTITSSFPPQSETIYLPETAIIEDRVYEKKRYEIVKGEGNISVDYFADHKIILSSESQSLLGFILHTHYFPGWKFFIDGQERAVEIDKESGFMKVSIPSGIHKLEFRFTDTPVREISNLITLISFLIFLVGSVAGWIYIKKREKIYT